MSHFPLHTLDTAPDTAKPLLEHSQQLYGGTIPNLHAVMAEAPALLEAYQRLNEIFDRSSLDLVERNILWLTINYENGCTYCMGAHTAIAHFAGLTDADIEALRSGTPLAEPKHEALRSFAAYMVEARGWAEDTELEALFSAGYTPQTALDVVLAIGMKTLSNYTNHIAHTPLDKAFTKYAWEKPATNP
jgi:AhpD family alkylhydroperoxidase